MKDLEKSIKNDPFLKNLLNNTSLPFYIGYFDQKIVIGNKAFEELTGYNTSELKNVKSLNDLTNTEFKQSAEKNIKKLLNTKKSVIYEDQLIRKDGKVVPIQVSSHLFKNEKMGYIYSFVTDISQQKNDYLERRLFLEKIQGERDKLAALVNNIPDEIWFVDKNKNFTLANPTALQEFGLLFNKVDAEEIVEYLEVYNPDGSIRPIDEAPSLRALKGENIRNLEEIIGMPETNEIRYRQVNASPLRDAYSNIIGSVSVVHDITKRKDRENQMLKVLENDQQLSEIFSIQMKKYYQHQKNLKYLMRNSNSSKII